MYNIVPNSGNNRFNITHSPAASLSLHVLLEDANIPLSAIKAACTSTFSLNEVREGATPLVIALQKGREDVAELLIAQGANIAQNLNGETPLYIAAAKGYSRIIEQLIQRGADPNGSAKASESPLYFAATNGHIEAAKTLIRMGADVNAGADDGTAMLRDTVKDGHVQVVKLLIENGVHLNLGEESGDTPLIEACLNGNAAIVELLLGAKGIQLDVVENLRRGSALHYACIAGHKDIVASLVKKGAALNIRDAKGYTPLLWAMALKHADVGELLLNVEGLQINEATQDGWTALHFVSQGKFGSIESAYKAVKSLIEKGADLNAKTDDGETPLKIASRHGKDAIVELLLKANGIKIHEVDKNGKTALHEACVHGRLKIVELLIAHGAELNARDKCEDTPLILACTNPEDKRPFLVAEIVKVLVNTNGIQINATNEDGYTALYAACASGLLDVVKLLIEKGGDPNVKTKKGWLLLHCASQVNVKIAELLLAVERIQVDVVDELGKTALHYACSNGRFDIIKALMSSGADPSIKDKRGYLCFECAPLPTQNKLCFRVTQIQKENLKRAAAFLKLPLPTAVSFIQKGEKADLEAFSSLQKNVLESVVKNQSALLKYYEKTDRKPQFLKETAPFFLLILSPQFLKYCSVENPEIKQLFAAKDDAFLKEIERLYGLLNACIPLYSKMLRCDSYEGFFKQIVQPLQTNLAKMKDAYLSRRALDTKSFESLKKEFNEEDVFVLLSNWNVGVPGVMPDKTEYNAEQSYWYLLGIEGPKAIYEHEISGGEDLEKIGINADIVHCIECLEAGKDPETLWVQLKNEIHVRINDLAGIEKIAQQRKLLEEILIEIRDLPQVPKDPAGLFSRLRDVMRTVNLELLKDYLAKPVVVASST